MQLKHYFLGLVAGVTLPLVFLWPAQEPTPSEIADQVIEQGVLGTRSAYKRSDYIIFNESAISCYEGVFLDEKRCPGLSPNDSAPIENCTAAFINRKYPFGAEKKILVSLVCEGRNLPQFGAQSLGLYRQQHRNGYFQNVMPVAALVIVLFGGILIHIKRKGKL